MNWNDLKIFIAIADAGTLAGAAKGLKHNHSTVFRRLNALEQDIGTRLFDRLPGGYTLTPAGERMLELSREAEIALQTIERELAGRDLSLAGTVRLTTAPNIAHTIVPRALKKLRKDHPQIIVEVSVGDNDYDLSRREADLALRATSNPPEHLIGKKVMQLDWWLCGAKSTRKNRPSSIDDLNKVPLIGADSGLLHIEIFQWLEKKFRENIVARANDLSTMAALAITGVGYALLPSDQREDGLSKLFILPDFTGELWLLTHPDLRHVRRIKAVWDALYETIRK